MQELKFFSVALDGTIEDITDYINEELESVKKDPNKFYNVT